MSFMTRSQLREHVFKVVFQLESIDRKEACQHFQSYLNELPDVSEEFKDDLKARVIRILDHLPKIDKQLSEKTTGWKINRINKVDLAILRLGVYEILYDDDVPQGVAINEGVELAKKYSGQNGPAFVNGVLAKFTTGEDNG
jgi:N utilization substance protein B